MFQQAQRRRSSVPPRKKDNAWSDLCQSMQQLGRRMSFGRAVAPSNDREVDELVNKPVRRHSKGSLLHGPHTHTGGETAVEADQRRVVEAVIDLMPDAVCAVDALGVIAFANREFNSTMYTLGADGRRSLFSCISASDRHKLLSALQSIFHDAGADRCKVGECLTTTRAAEGEVDLFYSWTLSCDATKKIVLAIGRHVSEVRSSDLLCKWSNNERAPLRSPSMSRGSSSKEPSMSLVSKALTLDSTIFEDEEASTHTISRRSAPSAEQSSAEHIGAAGGLIEQQMRTKTLGVSRANRTYERLQDAQAEVRELRHALELKRHFVRSVGHEIRTPLTVVLSGLALIETDLLASHPALADVLAAVKSSCELSIGLLSDLLAYEKVEGGILTLDARLTDVAQLLVAALALFRVQAAASGVALEVRFDTDQRVMALVDGCKIGQVLRNLLSNALKFTPARGSVRAVLSLPSADTVRVEVRDSGPGLTAEQQKQLFGRIVQFNPAELQGGQGTGIGLFMSKGVMDLHGGVIGVRSEGLNTGCTFFIELPIAELCDSVAEVDPIADMTHVVDPVKAVGRRRVRVLVVDDGALCRKMIARQLTAMHCECVEAESGGAALQQYRDSIASGRSFDVILMDAQMPGMNGDEASVAIRLLGFAGKIFGVTGAASAKSRQHFLAHGADKVYLKPLSPDDMRAIVLEASAAR